MSLWESVGKTIKVGTTSQILFRDTNDYGSKIGAKPIRVSRNWYVWEVNERFKDVGKLEGENRKAYIEIVMNT
ncbi:MULTISPECIES: hypothetical protein [unclassified Sphingobacterium]|uniref:hypothetical protein n=1 Tax=unclassified Sphingobacterium TaxID=2609468 RepID=UPI0010F37607|nr:MULTISPECIES: hypothetical protein [unclassified Sphingobacterium]MCS3557657.1 hypothetical protein [Sphingobacterium sp. JUb21]TCQ95069.1 hypothetical protein EDF66_1316 [Sphingobacterium sp. JUb20]